MPFKSTDLAFDLANVLGVFVQVEHGKVAMRDGALHGSEPIELGVEIFKCHDGGVCPYPAPTIRFRGGLWAHAAGLCGVGGGLFQGFRRGGVEFSELGEGEAGKRSRRPHVRKIDSLGASDRF